MLEEGRTWFTLDSPIQYVGMHSLRDASARYVSRYSPGMAILVAAVTRTASVEASIAINAVLALVTLAGLGMLVGTRLGERWGVVAMVALGVSPVFIGQAMLLQSHMAVTALLVWGVHLLVRWRERGEAWRAFFAGLLLGFVPIVRPSEAMLGLGVGWIIVATARAGERPWRHVALAIVGALTAIAPLLLYNKITFGSVARTAYAITREQSAFDVRHVASNLPFYAEYLLRDGLGIFALLAVAGIFYLLRARGSRTMGYTLLVLIAPILAVYLAFHYVPNNDPSVTVRYVLPALPLATYAAISLISGLTARWSARARSSAVGLLLVGHVAWGAIGIDPMTRRLFARKDRAATVNRAALELVPPGSVIFSSEEAFLANLDIKRSWRVADRLLSLDSIDNAVLDGELPQRGMGRQRGKRRIQTVRFDGLDAQQRDSLFGEEARRWGRGADVYYVGVASALDHPTSPRVRRESFVIVAERPLNVWRRAGRSEKGALVASESLVVARWRDSTVGR